MKRLFTAAFVLTAAASAFAQGYVMFNTRIPTGYEAYMPGQTIHIWGPSATAPSLSMMGLGSNDSPSGTTPFGSASGMALIGAGGRGGRYGYATTYVQLIGALGSNQPESTLAPLGQTTTFRSGNLLGIVSPIEDIIGEPGGPWQDAPFASFEIVAWDNSSGLYSTWAQASGAWEEGLIAAGHSAEVNVSKIGGYYNLPSYLIDMGPLVSFNLYVIPEPSAVALVALSAAALIIPLRRK